MIPKKRLVGKDLTHFMRAADMLCLWIGDTIIFNYRDGPGESSEYRIHFQCQWRFIKEGKILIASHDIYNPYDQNLEFNKKWKWDLIGRKKEQSSVFDVRREMFIKNFLPLKITNIHFVDTCDLHIDFDKGIYFDTFITCSTKREYYRFMDMNKKEHYVIFEEEGTPYFEEWD